MKITRFRSLALVLGVLIAMLGTSTALAYDFPSTNEYNKANGGPYVEAVDAGANWVTLAFYNPKNYGAFFEYRIDGQMLTDGESHAVVDGDFEYPGVWLANSGSSPTYRKFFAYHTVEVRLALGAERDWDFDWVTFNVPSLTNCVIDTVDTTMTLQGDCTTTATIYVPDGYTLNGNGHTITAVDPEGAANFNGAIVQNDGTSMNVINLGLRTEGLTSATALAGIRLVGAGGILAYNTITDINLGASGSQQGSAIEVLNQATDAEHRTVEIANNVVDDYSKTGILVKGEVEVNIHHNWVGDSATQANLAANSLQVSGDATGIVTQNTIYGNQWLGDSYWVATAVLIIDADGLVISKNNIRGNSEIGIYVYANDVMLDNNKVFDEGDDSACHLDCQYKFDIGIGNYGDHNTLTNNKVRGFNTPYEGLDPLGSNKVIGSPQD